MKRRVTRIEQGPEPTFDFSEDVTALALPGGKPESEPIGYFEGIDRQAWAAGGRWIGELVKQRTSTAGWFATQSGRMHPNSLREIIAGTYNRGSGPTILFLWGLCFTLAKDDPRTARRIMYEYLARVGVLPYAKEISVIGELAEVQRQLRQIAEHVDGR